ncbi:MAG: glycosyltransferase family 4 protein [Pseudomonadales bacterium]|nr:glycosyltransferase family 4 protein [Pseudomonadales bacterium]
MKNIFFVVNEAWFFLSHRLPLALEAQKQGYQVKVICRQNSEEERLKEYDIEYKLVDIERGSGGLISELRLLLQLYKIYRSDRPDLVHHITSKPVICGTIAARLASVPAVVNAIPGRGFVANRRGFVARIRKFLVNSLYKFALAHKNMAVVFQNRDDANEFLDGGLIHSSEAHLIRGAGVDLDDYPCLPEVSGPLTFSLISRMLKDKGVREFVEAAGIIKRAHPDWVFQLVGGVDKGNPSSLDEETLRNWDEAGVINWLGHSDSIAEVLHHSHVVCLPSYGGEGIPKVLLEATASGRAIITTDIPGCRELVRDGATGLLIPPRNSNALADAMMTLGTDEKLRARLSVSARERTKALFSVQDVVRDTFLVYEGLFS